MMKESKAEQKEKEEGRERWKEEKRREGGKTYGWFGYRVTINNKYSLNPDPKSECCVISVIKIHIHTRRDT